MSQKIKDIKSKHGIELEIMYFGLGAIFGYTTFVGCEKECL
jgi:hypothetical protein